MNLRANIVVTGLLEINDKQAAVLEHLTSYSLVEWFKQHCNLTEMPEEFIKETLQELRNQLHKLLKAKKRAEDGFHGRTET